MYLHKVVGFALSKNGSNPYVPPMQRQVTLHSLCQTVHLPA